MVRELRYPARITYYRIDDERVLLGNGNDLTKISAHVAIKVVGWILVDWFYMYVNWMLVIRDVFRASYFFFINIIRIFFLWTFKISMKISV